MVEFYLFHCSGSKCKDEWMGNGRKGRKGIVGTTKLGMGYGNGWMGRAGNGMGK